MSAAIVTILDAGWSPSTPTVWVNTNNETADISGSDISDIRYCMGAVAAAKENVSAVLIGMCGGAFG